MKSVLVMAIGPVQDFIASARRSGDLWFGSWLLSELSKAVAKGVVDKVGELSALVFPAPETDAELTPHSDLNVANKIVAVVSSAEVETVARNARKNAEDRLAVLAAEAFGRVKAKGGIFEREIADRQIADLLEFNWASAEIESEAEYKAAREKAERILAARKSLRDFAPVTWGSSKPKSSLDGMRESVLPEPKKGNSDEATRYRKFRIRGEERLCGVGLMKRNAQRGQDVEDGKVFSTSHVAALPLIARMAFSPQAQDAMSVFIGKLTALGIDDEELGSTLERHPVFDTYDGRLLFEERYIEFFEEEADRSRQRDKQRDATAALRDFLRAATGGKRPSPYYGLIHADGDGMGAAIDHCDSPEGHQRLSRSLADFADKDVSKIVKLHNGSLVYAGGDDVLAYVPLHTALACAKKIAEAFKTRLDGFPAENGDTPTLSVGLAVSHHLDSLADALDRARRAEKVAKRVPGKNALAIIFDKRGGAETTVKGTWDVFDTRLNALIDLYSEGAIPHGAAYELRGMSLRLDEERAEGNFPEAIRKEALRILKRKREGGGEKLSDKTTGQLEGFLKDRKVSDFANELIIAREFDKAMRLFDPTRGEKGAKS